MKTMAFDAEIGTVREFARRLARWVAICSATAAVGMWQGLGALAAEAGSGSAPAVAAGSAPGGATPDSVTNHVAEFPADKGLQFNFRNASLETVLSYMSQAADFVIHPEVSLNGRVDVWSDKPLSKEEAIALLERVLSDQGYAVVRDGRLLTIFSATDARHRDIPIVKFTSLDDIPRTAEVATYILPVRTLNPVALVSSLRALVSPTMELQANESANALLVTDSRNNIRRLAELVLKLDAVSSSINTIEVYPLKYADAKALTDVVRQLFPSQDSSQNNSSVAGFFGAPFGAAPGPAPAATGATAGAGTRVTAISDDHSNSLIVSAPDALLSTIRELVRRLDQPVADVTEVRMFKLRNADATEMATLLASLFPDAGDSADATASPVQFGGMGAFGAVAPGGAPSSSGASQHMKKMSNIVTVPDPRTQSLVVSASGDIMPQIADMISQLDELNAGRLNTHSIELANAEGLDVMQIVQDVFPAGSTSSSSPNTTQNNILQQRAQTLQQNMNSSGPGSGSTSSSSSASGPGSGTGVATGF